MCFLVSYCNTSLFFFFFFLMIRRPPRSTLSSSSAASDVYKRQYQRRVRGQTSSAMAQIIFVPMCADFVHVGHINILEGAAAYGDVYVLLMTDEAMKGYKRAPRMSYEQRERILRAFQLVKEVVPCEGPHTYAEMTREFKPAYFCHGDDWKTGPQAQARAEVMDILDEHGGKIVEPKYTASVSSTGYQDMFRSTIQESKHTGVLVRTVLNDLKRVPDVIEKETGLSKVVLENLIQGRDLDRENMDSVLRLLHHNYPATMKHLVVDLDDSNHGIWHKTAEESTNSGRVLDRVNGLKEQVHYYNYMDTATSSLSPFKPELIEQLVSVADNEPLNPLVVMNKGHLLSQLTFFIGPVNFYCTVRGERQCKVMNTGDSCLITPYVPHSFTSRDPEQYAAIVAVTFSGFVRDVLNDLVHHDISRLMTHAGDRRDGPMVFLRKVERFAELRGLTVADVMKHLTQTHSQDAIDHTLDQTAVDPAVIGCISDLLDVPRGEFEILQLEADQEVTYAWAKQPEAGASRKDALASCKHHAEAGGFDWSLNGTEEQTSQFFSYVYNYGEAPAQLSWADQNHTLAHGDSVVIKPFIPVTFSASGARLVVCKVAGCVNNSVMHECSLFANEGLQRMNQDTSQWW
eukprot:TRINITY_DN10648_c0_g5_i1.p1 TRINITY_DN10648_c0_g5~~TRINITY_DN10648_c0_g5_i1.p1  ORF type:complete len:629 (-),score=138.05 TRINITY_DN10648_c0_g5_i1:30-1916(-)